MTKRCGVAGCKLMSSFPDSEGRPRTLCAEHAEEAGTHLRAPPGCGASKKAMERLDRICAMVRAGRWFRAGPSGAKPIFESCRRERGYDAL